ncbi:hypothetical protein ABPG75_006751 [Micractinium tetrahymenae]
MQQVPGAAAPHRPALRPGGGRGRAPAAPDPTAQQDRHTTLGSLLLRAERGPDPTERILAVARVVLTVATDLLRPGSRGFADTPTVVLGQHYLSRRPLAERHRGDAMQLFLQELCSHEPLAPTQHAKYAAPSASSGGAPAAPAATLSLRLRPAAAARQQPGGLLSQLGAGGKDKVPDGLPPAWLECALQGELVVAFPRHAETYVCTLPSLLLAAPLAEACPLDLTGTATVACEATGLSAALHFRPFRGGAVRGGVAALLGEGQQEVASILGSWQGTVMAESPEGSGVLFEAAQLRPPISLAANLAEPGPRAATRLWAALLESLIFVDSVAAGREGKHAAELAAALPAHLKRSLLFEVESSGLKPKQQVAEEAPVLPASSAAAALPPCVLEHQGTYGGLSYQLHYRLQAV